MLSGCVGLGAHRGDGAHLHPTSSRGRRAHEGRGRRRADRPARRVDRARQQAPVQRIARRQADRVQAGREIRGHADRPQIDSSRSTTSMATRPAMRCFVQSPNGCSRWRRAAASSRAWAATNSRSCSIRRPTRPVSAKLAQQTIDADSQAHRLEPRACRGRRDGRHRARDLGNDGPGSPAARRRRRDVSGQTRRARQLSFLPRRNGHCAQGARANGSGPAQWRFRRRDPAVLSADRHTSRARLGWLRGPRPLGPSHQGRDRAAGVHIRSPRNAA